MKTIIIILSLILSSKAYSWSCPATDLTDLSARSNCVYRMLSHFIELEETNIIESYKEALAEHPSTHIDQFRFSSSNVKRMDRLRGYYDLINLVNKQTDNVYITNKAGIPLVCPASS